ncbi:MAG: EamA family transporter RarD [Paracoccaceae bacterium]
MTETSKGLLAMILACTIWGLSPIYYKELSHIPALEVMSHRIWWSLVFFVGVLALQSRLREIIVALSSRLGRVRIVLAAAMIWVNWFLFIYAVQINRTTETSLGYFIYPLVAVFVGRFIFGENLRNLQWLAVGLAALAVAMLTYGLGVAPWISIVLAITFAIYTSIKKGLQIGPVVSVTCEILIVAPTAIIVIVLAQSGGQGGFGITWYDSLLLIISGPLTALPLLLFSFAVKRITMATVGLLQYLNPTLQFFCAVAVFGEPFGPWQGLTFPLIWMALAIFSLSAWSQARDARKASVNAAGVGTTETYPASESSAKP